MRVLNLVLGMAATLAAQDMRPVDDAWQRLQTGGVDATPALQVSSQVRVLLRRNTQDNRITFRLIQSFKGRKDMAVHRLTGVASISSTPGGTTVITAQGWPAQGLTYATLEVDVPMQVTHARLEILKSGGGDIDVDNFRGSIQINTPAGDIVADRIGGSVHAFTGGGHIRVGSVGGDVKCNTGAGSITVGSAREVTCDTVGGEILVNRARGPVILSSGGGNITVDQAGQSVNATSTQGAITVGRAGGIVTANTRGGTIRIGSAAGVRADSAAGPVHLSGASGPLNVSTAIGSILAELMAGARLQDSSLMAASGDITVMIPSNVALSVMATNERGGVPRIQSDYSGVRTSPWSFQKPPLAEAAINGGGPMLMLSGSGMIYLRRTK